MDIRRATAAEAVLLGAIHEAAFPAGQGWSEDAFAGQLGLPGVFALVAPPDGLVLVRVAADEAEILTLGVVPEERRHGLGTALLRAAEHSAAAEGAVTMYLEVAANNAAARQLYAAAGYLQVGQRAGYYSGGADALVLAKRLSGVAAAGA